MKIERFSKELPGKVWNMLLNADNNWLVMEVRDHASKKVSFWILDIITRKWIWEDVEFEESWWLNLLATKQGNVYFNYFPDEKNPDSKKIIVVDVKALEVIEETDTYAFEGKQEVLKNNQVQSPLYYVEDSDHFVTVRKFINQRYNHDIIKAVDYLEQGSKVFISYYLYAGEKMDNYLLVMDAVGEALIHEKIDDELDTIGMATFFTFADYLITVKNKTEVLIYTC